MQKAKSKPSAKETAHKDKDSSTGKRFFKLECLPVQYTIILVVVVVGSSALKANANAI